MGLFKDNLLNILNWGPNKEGVDFGSAAPSSAYVAYAKGAVRFNNNVTAATPVIGWVCVTAGSPGTWVAFGSAFPNFISYSGAASNVPTSPWTAPTLLNSWVNYNAGTNSVAGYFKDASGVVHLKGTVKSGSSASAVMFTLPAGFRPAQPILMAGNASPGAHAQILVDAAGNVSASAGGSTTYTNIDGLSFLAEA